MAVWCIESHDSREGIDYDSDPRTNVVDILICRVRNRIDKDFEPKLIHTVRGMGYVLCER
ncbi:MAG: hypothetical protein F9K32_04710 [Desulfobulbaceae bacterium]|nr:MAG: hypothetical protein F9K32_04710 [Desulfobulbaceae bacterium]